MSDQIETDFAEWWAEWPEKKDRTPAWKAYRAKRRAGATAEDLTHARDTYLDDYATGAFKGQRYKRGATLLNQWEDYQAGGVIEFDAPPPISEHARKKLHGGGVAFV